MMTTKEEITEFLAKEFPQSTVSVVEVGHYSTTVRQEIDIAQLRPGNTVSGPVLMAVADSTLYVAIPGEIGLASLAVTTSFNINFLRKPSVDSAIIGECRLLKVGKSLAGEHNEQVDTSNPDRNSRSLNACTWVYPNDIRHKEPNICECLLIRFPNS
jgi:acyl-coenzyme A thioesterase PaaI-like protein